MKMNKYLYIGLLVMMASCAHHESARKERAALPVKTQVVSVQTDNPTARYVGVVEPIRETPLSFQATGRVVTIAAKNGDRVRKGQLILQVDSTQALNAYHTAEAALQHARDGYERVSKVHSKGVVPDQKMVEIESQLTQAQSVYAAAAQQLSECSLTAPCNGVVSGLSVEKGETVIPGTRICSILDMSGFCVKFTVPEGEVRNLSCSGKVECAAVGAEYPVTITEKSVRANPVTHTYEVKARIDGGLDVLMAGMVAKVQMSADSVEAADGTIVIPAKCVLLKPDGHTVWIKKDGIAERRYIQIGGYQADGVCVKSGLAKGDSLITEGYQKLYEGCKVVER